MTALPALPARRHRGFVLITALIFLVVLTLVAVLAVRSTGLELRMSSNNALHTEVFESSEAPRLQVGRLVDVLGFNAESGWPVSIGGGTPNNLFDYTIPAGMTIYNTDGVNTGTPSNWFVDIPETGFDSATFNRVARFSSTVATGGSGLTVTSDIAVQRMRTATKSGCDLGGAGYEGVSSKNCLDFYFLITSRSQDASNTANYETSSVYRYVPPN